MLGTYLHSFTLENGRKVFVPSLQCRATGKIITQQIKKRWRVPAYFFHLRKGGHVAALKHHAPDSLFATLDISGFFDSITRTKAYRALRSIGIDRGDALEIVRQSLVEKTKKNRDFSVPYGFVQSPILASLALDRSALGKELRRIAQSNHIRLSCYVDDIILSGNELEDLARARLELIHAAERSLFRFSPEKSRLSAPEVEVFNVRLSRNAMHISNTRMLDFQEVVQFAPRETMDAVVAYVASINREQADELRALFANPIPIRPESMPRSAS